MGNGRRLGRWIGSWDLPSWLSASLCVVAFGIMMLGGSANEPSYHLPSPPLWETLASLLLLPLGFVVLLPLVAAPQFVTFWLIRRIRLPSGQATLLLISAGMLVPYYRFMAGADLTSTSTAALGAAFYPIYLAMFFVPASFVVYWLSRRRERSRAASREHP